MSFAGDTTVSVERTKVELEKLVTRAGATQYASGWDGDTAVIGFTIQSRVIRFLLPMPNKADKQFLRTPKGAFMRTPEGRQKAWEQACRSRWRALLLVVKAKLEAVQCGISTIEDEFMAWTVTGDGRTIGEIVRPLLPSATAPGRTLAIAEHSTLRGT